MEFEEVRPYQIGDDVRSIDWNVTARYGEPFVKIFREERELTFLPGHQALAGGVGRCFGPVGGGSFGEDAGNVVDHGPDADDQLLTDLPVIPAQGHESQHFHLPYGKTVRIGRECG